MSNLYNRIKEASDGVNEYQAQAELSIYSQNKETEINYDKKVVIPFNIDMEFRTWGLAGVSILATSTITVPYTTTGFDSENGEEREVQVDLSTAETEWVAAGFFGISELILSLTADGGLASAKLVACYIDPTRG